jgi:hypothetical protein
MHERTRIIPRLLDRAAFRETWGELAKRTLANALLTTHTYKWPLTPIYGLARSTFLLIALKRSPLSTSNGFDSSQSRANSPPRRQWL